MNMRKFTKNIIINLIPNRPLLSILLFSFIFILIISILINEISKFNTEKIDYSSKSGEYIESDTLYTNKLKNLDQQDTTLLEFNKNASKRISRYEITKRKNVSEDITTNPIINKSKVLPHDGLFIRRNNQFGSKFTVGIKELIEKGVMIDQKTIRFDDFIALKTSPIPLPSENQPLSICHGICKIPDSQKFNNNATHFLEITLRAPDKIPQMQQLTYSRPSINYIFVIDASGSMEGSKLDMVKNSIIDVFNYLSRNDNIGIIKFNDNVETVLKSIPKKDIKLTDFSYLISNLIADGGTDLNLGISYGIDEISRYSNINTINHIFLFTDGNPTSGETDWIKIRQNVAKNTRGSTGLSILGFGTDANITELNTLAGVTGGKFVYIIDKTDILSILEQEIIRRDYITSMNLQLKINIDRDITINHFYGHDLITDQRGRAAVRKEVEKTKRLLHEKYNVIPQNDIIFDQEGLRIFVPDIGTSEVYCIVLEVTIPDSYESLNIGDATIQYTNLFKPGNDKKELSLSFESTIPKNIVLEHAYSLMTSEIVFYTLEDLYQEDVDMASNRLNDHIDLLTLVNNYLKSSQLKDDIITLRKLNSLSNNLGLKYVRFDEQSQSNLIYIQHSLNRFGQVRNGFLQANYMRN